MKFLDKYEVEMHVNKEIFFVPSSGFGIMEIKNKQMALLEMDLDLTRVFNFIAIIKIYH